LAPAPVARVVSLGSRNSVALPTLQRTTKVSNPNVTELPGGYTPFCLLGLPTNLLVAVRKH